jgi:hypothetical protein
MPRYTSQGNVDEENNYAREVQSQINMSVTGKSWRTPIIKQGSAKALRPLAKDRSLPSSGRIYPKKPGAMRGSERGDVPVSSFKRIPRPKSRY